MRVSSSSQNITAVTNLASRNKSTDSNLILISNLNTKANTNTIKKNGMSQSTSWYDIATKSLVLTNADDQK